MSPEERAGRGMPALKKLLRDYSFETVWDVGCGPEAPHAKRLVEVGKVVSLVDPVAPSMPLGGGTVYRRFLQDGIHEHTECIWCCHCLEHQGNPAGFLEEVAFVLAESGGIFAVTVPPLKHEIVTGHLTLWNAGLLLYHLVLAGFDCSCASVLSAAYDVSVIVRHRPVPPAALAGSPTLASLAPYFPLPVAEGFDGRIERLNW